jgi:hypothetical protein
MACISRLLADPDRGDRWHPRSYVRLDAMERNSIPDCFYEFDSPEGAVAISQVHQHLQRPAAQPVR